MDKYLNIDGTEELLQIFGGWPSFHDSEILSVLLDRNARNGRYGPTVTVKIHCFQMTNKIVSDYYETIKHNIITFAFYDVVEFHIRDGFGHQNPLNGLFISDIRSDQLENINYEVHFDAHSNCDLYFKCSKIAVLSVEPGIPEDSVYMNALRSGMRQLPAMPAQ